MSFLIPCSLFIPFKIIDERFANFLYNKFNNIPKNIVYFGLINNQIFLNINYEQKNYFQIMNLNTSNNFSLEYIIEIIKNNIFNDLSLFNNYIFNNLLKNGIHNLVSKGNQISLGNNNIIFNVYLKNYGLENNVNTIFINNENNLSNSVISKGSNLSNKTLIYSPPIKSNKCKTFRFEPACSLSKAIIYFEPDKKINELIKLYFTLIKRPELFGNKDVVFLSDGKYLNYEQEVLIKDFYGEKKEFHTLIILVQDEKSKK